MWSPNPDDSGQQRWCGDKSISIHPAVCTHGEGAIRLNWVAHWWSVWVHAGGLWAHAGRLSARWWFVWVHARGLWAHAGGLEHMLVVLSARWWSVWAYCAQMGLLAHMCSVVRVTLLFTVDTHFPINSPYWAPVDSHICSSWETPGLMSKVLLLN